MWAAIKGETYQLNDVVHKDPRTIYSGLLTHSATPIIQSPSITFGLCLGVGREMEGRDLRRKGWARHGGLFFLHRTKPPQ